MFSAPNKALRALGNGLHILPQYLYPVTFHYKKCGC